MELRWPVSFKKAEETVLSNLSHEQFMTFLNVFGHLVDISKTLQLKIAENIIFKK